MNIEISSTALMSFLQDFKKKEICPKERALLIKQCREGRGISGRELALELGIPHSTLLDWELWNKISTDKIRQAHKAGYTKTDIYKSLRNKEELKRLDRGCNVMDRIITQFISDIRYYVQKPNPSTKTTQHIKELQNVLNRILMRIDK